MLRQAENLGESSGIDVISDVPCKILEGSNWKIILENSAGNIFFTDEESSFVNTEEFASMIRESDNYFVLITRENLYNLPYSADEIYGLHESGKYNDTRKVYQQMYHIYSIEEKFPIEPEKIIVEDSNSGYEFFKNISAEKNIACLSAGEKSNIFSLLKKQSSEEICVIADGAAIGPEMNRLYKETLKKKNIHLYLPESFEWLILSSGLISEKDIKTMLEEPENYIDSTEYFSWERFFTKLLVTRTEETYLKYSKSKLNSNYLHEKNKERIVNMMQGIKI
ncbi:Uncharacterised protein [uncultured Blautia sp.]